MKHNLKWTIFQLVAILFLITLFIITDQFMDALGTPGTSKRTMYLIGGMLFVLVSWIYIMLQLQIEKYPNLMEHKIWRIMPVILSVIGPLSFIVFVILATGPLMDWLDKWDWLLYIIMTYSMMLFFLFIMSLVHKFSESKHQVLYHTYAWTLGVLFILAFMI